jgi:hypothetical protein
VPDILVIREQTVEALSGALRSGRHGLDVVPGLLRRAIEEEVWKERKDWRLTREIIPAFPNFRAFVEAKPPRGLGTNIELIERIIQDDEDTVTLFRAAVVGKQGRPSTLKKNDNVIIKDGQQGNSRAYVLDRLKRSRPDLFDRVKAKELSANAAAIEAGFKRKPTPLDALQAAWRKATTEERAAFLREIGH